MLSVGRACVLAWEIVSLLREYNELLERSGLPPMEVGLGIAYQDSPPLYLMDGEHRITISDAINESDRLSSCSKRRPQEAGARAGVFQVYRFDAGRQSRMRANAEAAAMRRPAPELQRRWNLPERSGLRKLQEEISLDPCFTDLQTAIRRSQLE